MTSPMPYDRRTFLADLGRAGFAVAILGAAGCATTLGTPSPATSVRASASGDGSSRAPGTPATAAADTTSSPPGGGGPATGPTAWHRVNLGFVSAYVLVRAGEAAVVDTGVPGSEGAIAAALAAAGLGWSNVGHVILTHRHQDHAGSAPAVLDAAPEARAYAGAQDIPAISTPRPLTPVADGDAVFGLRIVATPGHTPGHVAVYDEAGGILVAGDAMRTVDGKPTPPGPDFTEDMGAALASIAKMGALRFETLLVGHGEPIASGAAGLVRALAGG